MSLLGANIKKIRTGKRPKITRAKMGEDLGTTGTTIYRWETGENDPDPETISRIAKYLGVTVSELWGERQSTPTQLTPEQVQAVREAIKEAMPQNTSVASPSQAYQSGPASDLHRLIDHLDEASIRTATAFVEALLQQPAIKKSKKARA